MHGYIAPHYVDLYGYTLDCPCNIISLILALPFQQIGKQMRVKTLFELFNMHSVKYIDHVLHYIFSITVL